MQNLEKQYKGFFTSIVINNIFCPVDVEAKLYVDRNKKKVGKSQLATLVTFS